MKNFKITNQKSGVVLGSYEGDEEQTALDAMSKDAGYKSYEDLLANVPGDDDELLIEEE